MFDDLSRLAKCLSCSVDSTIFEFTRTYYIFIGNDGINYYKHNCLSIIIAERRMLFLFLPF